MNLEEARRLDRIHPYPAKFTIDLAIENIEKYSTEGGVVYDPFVGSGTTLLAAKLLNRNSVGTDINYIAILISKFKTMNLTRRNLDNLELFITNFKNNYSDEVNNANLTNYPSIEHWFCNDAIKILSLIKNKIYEVEDENESIFCKLVFSSIINSASNQESDTRYAAVFKPKVNIDYVANLFIKKFYSTLEIYSNLLNDLTKNVFADAYLQDSKNCINVVKEDSVDLILTSPPYPNTYDYYLYHKHRMNWLGYDVKFSMNSEIGSRREFSSLKKPKEKFDEDMYEILSSANKTLKKDGIAILVMGDGQIQGELYEAKSNMERICQKLNWSLIDYSFTYLDETSRSFQKSYRTKGKKEHILVFKKE